MKDADPEVIGVFALCVSSPPESWRVDEIGLRDPYFDAISHPAPLAGPPEIVSVNDVAWFRMTVSGPLMETRTPDVALDPWQLPHPLVLLFNVLPVLPPEEANSSTE